MMADITGKVALSKIRRSHHFLYEMLKEKGVPPEMVLQVYTAFAAMSKARQEPAPLAGTIAEGLRNNMVSPETLRAILPSIMAAAEAGHDPHPFAENLFTALKSKALTRESLLLMLPSIETTAKSGHDPEHLARPLLSGLYYRALTERSLPVVAAQLRGAFEASAKAGHSTEPLARNLSLGIKNGVISAESLPAYLDLFSAMPRAWKHSEIMDHAIAAHRFGVPAGKIPHYQKELIERGHFPNAGLVHELHKVKMKGAMAKTKPRGPIKRRA